MLVFKMGVAGAAWATVIAQILSAVGITIYTLVKFPQFFPERKYRKMNQRIDGDSHCGQNLGNHGCPGSTRYPHLENQHKDQIQHDVGDGRKR